MLPALAPATMNDDSSAANRRRSTDNASPSRNVFLDLLPLSPPPDAADDSIDMPLLPPIPPPAPPALDVNHSRAIPTKAPASSSAQPPIQPVAESTAPPPASAARASPLLRATSDKRRRSPDTVPVLSSMKRRRAAAMSALYAHKTSSVGSQYQARVEPWDADAASELRSERQQAQTANGTDGLSDAAGDSEGQPFFSASLLPDAAAEKRQHVDEYWDLLSSLQSYSQRHVTQTEALHLVHRSHYALDESISQLRQLAGFPDDTSVAAEAADDSDHVALTDPACTVCGDGGDVFLCDAAGCRRVYHAECLQLEGVPERYECPAHFCRRCQARVLDPCQACRSCPSAFCDAHISKQKQHHLQQVEKLGREATLFEFKCERCYQLERPDNNDDRATFLSVFTSMLEGELAVDLQSLLRAVAERGGVDAMLLGDGWQAIHRDFGFSRYRPNNPSVRQTTNCLSFHYYTE